MHRFVSVLLVLGFPFIMTEVVDSFSKCSGFFFKGEPPMIKGILEKSVSQDNNRYKLVCQRYKNKYRFATLYDINNKIPVFSAYTYTESQGQFVRPKIPWMIEPQLERETAEMRSGVLHQACTKDYINQEDLNRGHLFPHLHTADEDTSESTFTMTNIVPQKKSFNGGSWAAMERKVKNTFHSRCRDKTDSTNKVLAYVLTGAIPSQTELLNEKVNIPSHMWTVFCCYNSVDKKWESQAHWAENIKEERKEKKMISEQSLQDLQVFLKNVHKEYTLFKGDCLTLLNADGSQPSNEDSDDQQNDEEKSYWSDLKQLPSKVLAWLCG